MSRRRPYILYTAAQGAVGSILGIGYEQKPSEPVALIKQARTSYLERARICLQDKGAAR